MGFRLKAQDWRVCPSSVAVLLRRVDAPTLGNRPPGGPNPNGVASQVPHPQCLSSQSRRSVGAPTLPFSDEVYERKCQKTAFYGSFWSFPSFPSFAFVNFILRRADTQSCPLILGSLGMSNLESRQQGRASSARH
jgi:hypothetical protein